MTKKTILSSALLSLVCVSLIACDGNSSRQGNDAPAVAVDTSLEGQIESTKNKITALNDEKAVIEDNIAELAKPMGDARAQRDEDQKLLDQAVAEGVPFSHELEKVNNLKESQNAFDELKNEYTALSDEIKVKNMKIGVQELTLDKLQAQSRIKKANVALNDLPSGAPGHQVINDMIAEDQAIIEDIEAKLNPEETF
jgi:peptidoglycan hydrolase CwlO-like protein